MTELEQKILQELRDKLTSGEKLETEQEELLRELLEKELRELIPDKDKFIADWQKSIKTREEIINKLDRADFLEAEREDLSKLADIGLTALLNEVESQTEQPKKLTKMATELGLIENDDVSTIVDTLTKHIKVKTPSEMNEMYEILKGKDFSKYRSKN